MNDPVAMCVIAQSVVTDNGLDSQDLFSVRKLGIFLFTTTTTLS